jgi:O-antigen ligase
VVALPTPTKNANRTQKVFQIAHLSLGNRWLWLGMAVLGGVGVATFPLQTSLLVLAGLVGGICLLIEPLTAVAITVVFGLFRALLAQRQPWIPDLGQVGFALILAVYTLRTLATRPSPLPRNTIRALLPLLLPAMLWLLLATLSLWGAADLPNGIKELLKWSQTLLLMAFLTAEIAQHPQKIWHVLGIALLAGLVQAGWGIYQFALRGHGPEHFFISPGLYRAYGSFHQPNPYGGFLGMVWPLAAGVAFGFGTSALTRIWKTRALHLSRQTVRELLAMLVFAGLAGILLGGLFASYSRGAWIGAASAVACMAFFLPRQWWLGPLVVLAVGICGLALWQTGNLPASLVSRVSQLGEFVQVYDVRGIGLNNANFSLVERIAHWQAGLGMANAHPWLGVGIGNYDAAYNNFRLLNWQASLGHAHNIYINTLAETGLLGLAAYLIFWLVIMAYTVKQIARLSGWQRGLALGLLGVWAHISTHHLVDNLYVNNLHLYFGVCFALLASLSFYNHAHKSSSLVSDQKN